MLTIIASSMFLFAPALLQEPGLQGYTEREQDFVRLWKSSAKETADSFPLPDAEVERWLREVSNWESSPETASGPRVAEASRRLGFNYYGRQVGDWATGMVHLRRAHDLAPEDPKVQEDLGRALILVGRRDEGIELLRRCSTKNALSFLRGFQNRHG